MKFSKFVLKIHFFSMCECYGQPSGKSVGLARHCVAPTRQGSQAVRNIIKGKWPAYIGKDVANKVPQLPRDVVTRILEVEHPGRDTPRPS